MLNSTHNNTLSGVLSDAGGGVTLDLTQSGTGTTYLTNTNTYTGTTLISAGTLQVGDNSVGGSTTGTLGSGPVTEQRQSEFQPQQRG